MRPNNLIAVLMLALVVGCASPDGVRDHEGRIKPGEPSKITLGMTKLEVMQALGRPENVGADSSGETLYYRLERPWWNDRPFKVQLENGKVVSFGVIEKKE